MTQGMRSTEFWIAAIAPMVLTILNQIFGWGLTAEMIGAGSVGPAGYAVSRGLAK